jgi:hypothetical protein
MSDRETTRVFTVRVTERMYAEIDRRAEESYVTRNAATVALIAAGLRAERDAATSAPVAS